MQAIVYSKFRYYKIEPSDIELVEPEPTPFLGGGPSRCVGIGIDEPACQLVLEDFFPGAEYEWTTFQDQIDFVTEGRCEIRYLLPPAYEESGTVIVEAPSVYLIPRGTRIVWRPLGDGPFRHVSVDFPNPGFPVQQAASVMRDQGTDLGKG